jgi:hypothetical protein
MSTILQYFSQQFQTLSIMMIITNAILHVILAGAVAKDASNLLKINRPVHLITPMVWGFIVLVGGIVSVAVYWFINHKFDFK